MPSNQALRNIAAAAPVAPLFEDSEVEEESSTAFFMVADHVFTEALSASKYESEDDMPDLTDSSEDEDEEDFAYDEDIDFDAEDDQVFNHRIDPAAWTAADLPLSQLPQARHLLQQSPARPRWDPHPGE